MRRLLLPLLAWVAAALGRPPVVTAGATSPTLVLSAAVATAAANARAVALEGSFDFHNAVQVGYPLEIVVFQGTRFARYPIAGSTVSGVSGALADGQLTEAEVPSLLGAGAPAAAGVRIVTMTGAGLRVTLPVEFVAGPARAVLFTVLAEGTVLSNPIDFVLP